MTDGEEVYAPDGELLGWAYQADDGGHVLIDENDDIIAATDANGNAADPAGYTLEGDEPYDDVEDLQAQIAELQEWREGYNPDAAGEAGREFSDQLGDQAWALDVGRQLRNLEEQLGRSLTLTEMHSLLTEARGDHEAGLPSDIGEAIDRATGLIPFVPGESHDQTEHQHGESRRAFMSQLIADSETVEHGAMPNDPPERMSEDYDLRSDVGDRGHGARMELMTDALNGHDTEGRTFDSSQTYNEED